MIISVRVKRAKKFLIWGGTNGLMGGGLRIFLMGGTGLHGGGQGTDGGGPPPGVTTKRQPYKKAHWQKGTL